MKTLKTVTITAIVTLVLSVGFSLYANTNYGEQTRIAEQRYLDTLKARKEQISVPSQNVSPVQPAVISAQEQRLRSIEARLSKLESKVK